MSSIQVRAMIGTAMLLIATSLVYWKNNDSDATTRIKVPEHSELDPVPQSTDEHAPKRVTACAARHVEPMLPVHENGVRTIQRRPAFDRALMQGAAANAKSPPLACKAWMKIIPLLDPKQASQEEQRIGWLNVADACSRGEQRSNQDLRVAKDALIRLSKLDLDETKLRAFQAKYPAI